MLSIILLMNVFLLMAGTNAAFAAKATGPLRVSTCNPRYFSDDKGTIVYLTGSHTWTSLQDQPPHPPLDFERYLALLKKHRHNFTKLWMLESPFWESSNGLLLRREPLPYLRSGAEKARDGLPRFDVMAFDQRYFDRLRERVMAAGDQGVYVAVMLFNGWSIEGKGIDKRNWLQRIIARGYLALGIEPPPWDRTNTWHAHPFNRMNNINGIDGDANHDGDGLEVHSLHDHAITALQERYIQEVIDTLNDSDNVLYEISNESQGQSTDWQYHMIRFIHAYEATKPKQHPVLMTWQYPGGANEPLLQSPAEAVSLGSDPRDATYRTTLPAADGHKVIISDTDHIWGEGGDPEWVWRSLTRGHNPIFMDRVAQLTDPVKGEIPNSEAIRDAMGHSRWVSERINLARMTPRSEICSTTYCLADPEREYLLYLPAGGSVTVSLGSNAGPFNIEWFDPTEGVAVKGDSVPGGNQELHAPFAGSAAIHLKSAARHEYAIDCQGR